MTIDEASMPHVCGDEPLLGYVDRDACRMPHVCGDEPSFSPLFTLFLQYAPRMWG